MTEDTPADSPSESERLSNSATFRSIARFLLKLAVTLPMFCVLLLLARRFEYALRLTGAVHEIVDDAAYMGILLLCYSLVHLWMKDMAKRSDSWLWVEPERFRPR